MIFAASSIAMGMKDKLKGGGTLRFDVKVGIDWHTSLFFHFHIAITMCFIRWVCLG